MLPPHKTIFERHLVVNDAFTRARLERCAPRPERGVERRSGNIFGARSGVALQKVKSDDFCEIWTPSILIECLSFIFCVLLSGPDHYL